MQKLFLIWNDRSLRNSIVFVLLMLVVFRIAAHIPIPGVNAGALEAFFAENEVLGLLNIFSGGGLENFSIVALGVGPYITASIIFQLLVMVVPQLEEMQKEGPQGQQKINQYTRLLTVPLAMLQGFGLLTLLQRSGRGVLDTLGAWDIIATVLVLTAGTMFLMWIGELISEKKIGNGISLLIFAGIVARIPITVQQVLVTYDRSLITDIVLFLAISVAIIAGIIFITEGQRNIPVSYARHVRGNQGYGGIDTHLPVRVNQAGVIPIIFAISVILFPPLVAQFFQGAQSVFLSRAAVWVITMFQNQLFYGILYFVLVFGFTYFYTAVIFHPDRIAENLQKQGGFIPGIRPGKQTAEFIGTVSNRIMLAGALFLGAIAVLPLVMQAAFRMNALVLGGTSVLIVVAVVIETIKQIDAQLAMREYERL